MPEARRTLIVVSNRGPVAFARDGSGARVARRGGGGLVTALRGLIAAHDVTWVASAMSREDRVVAEEAGGSAIDETASDGSPYRLRLLAHPEAAYDAFYNVVANPTLWFVQHHLWGLAYAPSLDHDFHDAWADGYVAVNRAFADAVDAELERAPGAAVFFHDYQLYVAPRLVRARWPDATLAHFVHIPWPDADAWGVLPAGVRAAVHDGLLACDVVGFHTRRWLRNFVRSSEEIVGADWSECRDVAVHGGRRTRAVALPISVDPAEFQTLATSEAVVEAERAIEQVRPERLVVRVDRTDPSKNVVRGFRAFELYLEAHPEAHGRVGMLALLDPSRQDIREYNEYLAAIETAARAVNERFARDGWMPVDLQVADDFPQAVAAYKQFDVLLVNAIFDGLNLVAKEAALVNVRDGVLVLSENAGVHEELSEWAIGVNPFDVAGQAAAIHAALELPVDDRRARLAAIRAHVRTNDIAAWIGAQLATIDDARRASRG